MKRAFFTFLLAGIIGITAFELKQLAGIDLGLTAANASAINQYISIGHSIRDADLLQDGLSSIPLSVNMTVQSAESNAILSVELIAMIVIGLGFLTTAAILWDGRLEE